MKRVFTIILALLLMVTLVACGNKNESTDTNAPSNNTTATETKPSTTTNIPASFREVPSKENLLEAYRNEVKYRSTQEDYFTKEEKVFLESLGYGTGNAVIREWNSLYSVLHEYFYPVVYRVEDEVLIVHNTGILSFESKDYSTQNNAYTFGYVHNPQPIEDEEEILAWKMEYGAIYNQTTGNISFWELGEKTVEYNVPKGAVYAGYSHWEGFLFRDGTKVYAVVDYALPGMNVKQGVKLIADGVDKVILADYAAGSDDWSQPLFLMKDGTIKVYCSWYGDKNAPADDPCHLQEIRYEGGYYRHP